jgi:hypothetical protein
MRANKLCTIARLKPAGRAGKTRLQQGGFLFALYKLFAS